jgi:hypothetical protein
MQHPVLFLGLMGFDAASEAALTRWVSDNAAQARKNAKADAIQKPIWQVVGVQEADALLIQGAGVAHGSGSKLQFDPALSKPTGSPAGVHLDAIKQPFALSDVEHLQALTIDVKNRLVFNPGNAPSLLETLQHFETILRPLRTLYALAMELTARHEELDNTHTFHLEHNGGLNAVIDPPNRRVFVRSSIQPTDIDGSAWLRRPKSANFAPSHFLQCTMDELAWVFAMHCESVDLPKRYTLKPIGLRRNPHVRASMMSPRHAKLIETLLKSPSKLSELQHKLTDSAPWIERDLFALYLTRSISTQLSMLQHDGHSTQQPSESGDNGTWMLHRMNRLIKTITGGLGAKH